MTFSNEKLWPDEKIEQLRMLWHTNLSMAGIAKEMGISRNAVCGKCHRLGFPSRVPAPRLDEDELRRRRIERQREYDSKRRFSTNPKRSIKMERPTLVPPPPFIGDLRIPFADLRNFRHDSANQCRFIADEPPGPHYLACGNETVAGKSYCGHCTELMKPKQFTMAERIENHHLGVRRHQRMLRRVA